MSFSRGLVRERAHVDEATSTLVRVTPAGQATRYRLAAGPRGLLRAAPSLKPGLTSLAEYEGPLMSQVGPTCQGHRVAQGLWIASAAAGNPLPWMPSPEGIWRDAGIFERVPHPDGTLPPISNDGRTTSDVIRALATCGVRPIKATPSPSGYTDVDEATLTREPRLDELEQEALTLITGEYALDLSDWVEAWATMQALLGQGFPLWVDLFVDTPLEVWGAEWTPSTPPVNQIDKSDPKGGGHALLLNELLVGTDGSITPSLLNWWGPWGAPSLSGKGNQTGHLRMTGIGFATSVYAVTVGKVVRT